jgi:multiple sugar transport system substrate-binding protein
MATWSRRQFLGLTIAVTAGSAIAACTPSTAPPTAAPTAGATTKPAAQANQPQPATGETVQYWVGWGGSYAGQCWDQLKKTDEFKQIIGPNQIEVKGSAGDAIKTAVAGGTPPDGASNLQYLDYMARDVLQPLDDWLASSSIVKKDNYLRGTWESGGYKGKMYGVPANEGFLRYALLYNSKEVADAGLDPKNPPATWSELMVWHKTLTKFDNAGNLKQIGLDPFDAMGGNLAIQDGFFPSVSWGWKWFDPDTGKFDLNNEHMIEAFDTMGAFVKLIGPDKLAGMRQVPGQGTWGGSYGVGVQAMIIDGYWRPGGTYISHPEVGKVTMSTWAPVPDSRKGVKVQGTGGHYVIIFKNAKHKELMFKIAEFLNTDKACQIEFDTVGFLPALTPFLNKVDPKRYPGLEFFFKSMDEATEWSSPARCPITEFAGQQWVQLREKVFRDQMSAKEAAAEFQKRCETEYKQAGFA